MAQSSSQYAYFQPEPLWQHIDCPVCGGASFSHLFDKQQQAFVECDECSLVLINPRPAYSQIVEIYQDSYSRRYVHKERSKMRRAHHRVRQLRKYVCGGRWLDIGCSAGFILEAARHAGFEVYGVDVDPTGIEFCRLAFGLRNLHQGIVESAAYPHAFFDVITLYDVLEHVYDLNLTLAELTRVLAPGGTIEISTPDLAHWRRPHPLESWNAVMPSKHLYYFSIDTLARLVERHGLRVVKRRFAVKPGLRVYLEHV